MIRDTDTPIQFFLSGQKTAVSSLSDIWHTPLPINRGGRHHEDGIFLTYGEYFNAVRRFLLNNRPDILPLAVARRTGRTITFSHIDSIRVFLEKHGEFYHPSRIETRIDGSSLQWVLNVAVSAAGIRCLQREYSLLKTLNDTYPYSSSTNRPGKH